jgi:hypothetical protein
MGMFFKAIEFTVKTSIKENSESSSFKGKFHQTFGENIKAILHKFF